MSFTRIEHVAIASKDTKALCRWYRDILGFEVVSDNQKSEPTYLIKLRDSVIELMPASDGTTHRGANQVPGISHIAFSVDDFDLTLTKLAAKGVSLDKVRSNDKGVRIGDIHDPDGNWVQFLYRSQPL